MGFSFTKQLPPNRVTSARALLLTTYYTYTIHTVTALQKKCPKLDNTETKPMSRQRNFSPQSGLSTITGFARPALRKKIIYIIT